MRLLHSIMMLAATAACADTISETTGSPSESTALTTAEVVLGYGEEKVVDGTVLRLNFVDVLEDSRCPTDVTCVWAGNAKVMVGIAAGSGPTYALELNTTLEPRSRDRLGVRVTLLSVTPEPVSDHSIPVGEYRVRLRVEPIP